MHERALRDGHLGLRDGAVAGDVDRVAAEEMQDADALLEAGSADGDELLGAALEPGGHHAAVVVPDAAKALPVAGVAPHHPVLHHLADGVAVGNGSRHIVLLQAR